MSRELNGEHVDPVVRLRRLHMRDVNTYLNVRTCFVVVDRLPVNLVGQHADVVYNGHPLNVVVYDVNDVRLMDIAPFVRLRRMHMDVVNAYLSVRDCHIVVDRLPVNLTRQHTDVVDDQHALNLGENDDNHVQLMEVDPDLRLRRMHMNVVYAHLNVHNCNIVVDRLPGNMVGQHADVVDNQLALNVRENEVDHVQVMEVNPVVRLRRMHMNEVNARLNVHNCYIVVDRLPVNLVGHHADVVHDQHGPDVVEDEVNHVQFMDVDPDVRLRRLDVNAINAHLNVRNCYIPLDRVPVLFVGEHVDIVFDRPAVHVVEDDHHHVQVLDVDDEVVSPQVQVADEPRVPDIVNAHRNDEHVNHEPVVRRQVPPNVPPRQRHAVVPHRVTYRTALRYGQESVEDIEPFRLGNFQPRCRYCNAKYFEKEPSNRQGDYMACCHLGHVELPPLLPCPDELTRLYTENEGQGNLFREKIRTINSNFAMASFTATVPDDRNVGQGAWCFTITGQIYHYVEPVPDVNRDNNLKLNQLYFIDTAEACNRRQAFLGDRVDEETLLLVENILREHNPLCQAFRAMAEVINRDDLRNVSIVFNENIMRDVQRYNLPQGRSEIAAVFEGTDPPFNVDLIVYPRHLNRSTELKNLNHYADPMVYPLLFPNGEFGYRTGVRHVRGNINKTVTFRQHYAYRIAVREGFSAIHNGGKLFQQYLVDSYCKVEGNDLWYIKQHQRVLRVDSYTEIRRLLNERANEVNGRVGKLVILPSSRVGSPRYMLKMYSDAMAILARHGKPDLFITFTTNPKWPEIKDNLEFRQKYEHRPDLVCRVFRAKFLDMMRELTEKQVLGVVHNYSYVIEFQKRGLPHAHLLITLRPEDKVDEENANDFICAEIPNRVEDPALYEIIVEHYMHKPCGATNPEAPCMRDGKCSKNFPMEFTDETVLHNVNRIKYRRRRDGRVVQVDGQLLDNRRVVPYNRYLAKKYECHINVEICASMASMKYLYKYVHKGHDCITLKVSEHDGQNVVDWDEVERYLDCRYISSAEAAYKLLHYPIQDRSHCVMTLPVHLEGEHVILFDENIPDEELDLNVEKPSKLMAWFTLNENDENSRNLLYVEIPEHYTWNNRAAEWKRRKQVSKMIGKLMEVSPDRVELLHLRILLGHQRGAVSFQQLKSFNGLQYDTYFDTCRAMNLVEDLQEYQNCLREMARERFPPRLRRMFALICCIATEEQIGQIPDMWETFRNILSEDYVRRGMCQDRAYSHCLRSIEYHLRRNGKTLTDFNLPNPDDNDGYEEILEHPVECIRVDTLNRDQRNVYDEIMNAIDLVGRNQHPVQNVFYVDGPAGTGKTYLYNAIITNVRVTGKHTIAVAWTGMASTLLTYGTTVHRAFKLPLELHDDTVAGWPVEAMQSRVIRSAAVIIWDEAPMSPKFAIEAVDKYLRDLMEVNRPMGGKIVVFGGDFRQVLPVVRRGNRARIINCSIKASYLWPHMAKRQLRINMRTDDDEIDFANWLLQLGNGQLPPVQVDDQVLLDSIVVPNAMALDSTAHLIDFVFGVDLENDPSSLAILCPTNKSAKEVNNMILERINDDVRIYLSSDKYNSEPEDEFVPTMEVLNSIDTSSLPPHELRLKKGVVVMLLRNIDLADGLCNGTRLKVIEMYNHAIDVEILTGKKRGERALIPRVRISTKEDYLPRQMTRFQFPLRMAFAMTINKSQGQTFDTIGIRLSAPCFAHGQLYVAFSRVRRFDNVRIYLHDTATQGSRMVNNELCYITQNIVYQSIVDTDIHLQNRVQHPNNDYELMEIDDNELHRVMDMMEQ